MHRDLKPGNILIFENKRGILTFKICDFGVSKIVNVTSKQSGQVTNNNQFTIEYAAPEQLNEIEPPSPFLIDSWAIGIIFYQLCTEKEHAFKIEGVERQRDIFFKLFKNQKVDYDNEFFKKNQKIKKMIEELLKFNPQERLDLMSAFTLDWMKILR